MKTTTTAADALAAKIDGTNNGYLFAPTGDDIATAEANPERFIVTGWVRAIVGPAGVKIRLRPPPFQISGTPAEASTPENPFTAQPVPADVLEEIKRSECERLGLEAEHAWPEPQPHAAYFAQYATNCPGYIGPVVVLLWPIDPGAVSTFIRQKGKWEHCNSSSW